MLSRRRGKHQGVAVAVMLAALVQAPVDAAPGDGAPARSQTQAQAKQGSQKAPPRSGRHAAPRWAERPVPTTPAEDRAEITWVLEEFQRAFREGSSRECSRLLMPPMQRRYADAFRSGGVFKVAGKSNQAILAAANAIAIDELGEGRARARYYTPPAQPAGGAPGEDPSRQQQGILPVGLLRTSGHWHISYIHLTVPAGSAQGAVTPGAMGGRRSGKRRRAPAAKGE